MLNTQVFKPRERINSRCNKRSSFLTFKKAHNQLVQKRTVKIVAVNSIVYKKNDELLNYIKNSNMINEKRVTNIYGAITIKKARVDIEK